MLPVALAGQPATPLLYHPGPPPEDAGGRPKRAVRPRGWNGCGRRGPAPAQGVRRRARRGRPLTGRRARRDIRTARAQRRRQDDHGGVHGGPPPPGWRADPGPRPGSLARARRAAPAHRLPAPGGGAARPDPGLGGTGSLRRHRPAGAPMARGPGALGAGGEGQSGLLQPLRWRTAATLHRPRAHQSAPGGLPRRADPGSGPRRAPGGLGSGPVGSGTWRHRHPGDPFHGGGAASSATASPWFTGAGWSRWTLRRD